MGSRAGRRGGVRRLRARGSLVRAVRYGRLGLGLGLGLRASARGSSARRVAVRVERGQVRRGRQQRAHLRHIDGT